MKEPAREPPVESSPRPSGVRTACWHERPGAIGHSVWIHDELDSSMNRLRALALDREPEGTAVLALAQTAGRGRRGRPWVSSPGLGLYLSVLLRPSWPVSSVSRLGILAAVAGAQTLEKMGVGQVEIEWPNDLVAEDAKLGGVLVEPRLGTRSIDFAVIGIGLNLLQEDEDWPPELRGRVRSLRMMGLETTPEQAGITFVRVLETLYRPTERGEWQSLWESWQAYGGSDCLPTIV